jgi:hypothetical protein
MLGYWTAIHRVSLAGLFSRNQIKQFMPRSGGFATGKFAPTRERLDREARVPLRIRETGDDFSGS